MQLKSLLLSLLLMSFICENVIGQQSSRNDIMKNLITENYALAESQYSYMMKSVPSDRLPQSYDANKNQLISREITWWCTGFYPGSLLYIYEQTKNETIKAEALRALKVIEPNQN